MAGPAVDGPAVTPAAEEYRTPPLEESPAAAAGAVCGTAAGGTGAAAESGEAGRWRSVWGNTLPGDVIIEVGGG